MEELSRSLDGTSTTAHGSFGEQGPKQSQNVVRSVVPPVQAVLPRAPSNWTVPTKMFLRYCRANVEAVHHWWTGIGWEALSGSGDLRLVSFIQLFFDFRWATNHEGPFLYKKKWYSQQQEVPAGCETNWGDRTKPFLLLWKAYLMSHGINVPRNMSKPSGLAIGK